MWCSNIRAVNEISCKPSKKIQVRKSAQPRQGCKQVTITGELTAPKCPLSMSVSVSIAF